MLSKQGFVSISDTLFHLQTSEDAMYYLLNKYKCKIYFQDVDPMIKVNDYKKIVHSPDVPILRRNSYKELAKQKVRDNNSGRSNKFKNNISKKVKSYSVTLDILQTIHSKYSSRIEPDRNETALSASYLLLAQAIALLRMAIDALSQNRLEATIILRMIDEAIDLAEFFLIENNSDKGKQYLKEWFRENKSPSNSVCRKSIAKWVSMSVSESTEEEILFNLEQVYYIKSKPVHNSYVSIIASYDGFINSIFDYGVNSFPRKLYELTTFYKSSILTLTQSFILCFNQLQHILTDDDLSELKRIRGELLK